MSELQKADDSRSNTSDVCPVCEVIPSDTNYEKMRHVTLCDAHREQYGYMYWRNPWRSPTPFQPNVERPWSPYPEPCRADVFCQCPSCRIGREVSSLCVSL